MGRRTYYSAFIICFSSFFSLPTFWNDRSFCYFFLPCFLNHFLSLLVPQSETVFSKVTSDFLITGSKAIFYSLPLCHITRIILSLDLPCRFVLLHFWLHILCSLWCLFFQLSYYKKPRDLIFCLFVLLSLLSFIVFPFNHAFFKLLCVCQRWHHFFYII